MTDQPVGPDLAFKKLCLGSILCWSNLRFFDARRVENVHRPPAELWIGTLLGQYACTVRFRRCFGEMKKFLKQLPVVRFFCHDRLFRLARKRGKVHHGPDRVESPGSLRMSLVVKQTFPQGLNRLREKAESGANAATPYLRG